MGGMPMADLISQIYCLGCRRLWISDYSLTNPHTQSWDLDLYAQDSWKASPKLTVNYGIRYEYQRPYTEANNDMSNYNVASNTILLADRGGNSQFLVNTRKNEFASRVGFAYQLNEKTVVRGGFGIFYTPEMTAVKIS
jgi:outer membrane receptor protein involved in Fe transport